MTEFVVTTEACRAIGRLPTQCMFPRRYGVDRVRFAPGNYSAWAWNVAEPAEFIGEDFPIMASCQPTGVSAAAITGFDLRGGVILNNSHDNTLTKNRFRYWGVRVRFDSSRNRVYSNDCIRADDAPIPLDAAGKPADVVLFQIKTGACLDNEFVDNDGAGWGDFFQATFHLGAINDCSGTLIAKNRYRIRPQDLLADGTMREHQEQFVDIKVPSEFRPLRIEENSVSGFRANARGTYPFCFQPLAYNIWMEGNDISNCTGGVFLKGSTDQKITSYRDRFNGVGCNYGEPTLWPGKRAVFCGPGAIHCIQTDFVHCGVMHENISHQVRPFRDCRIITGAAA